MAGSVLANTSDKDKPKAAEKKKARRRSAAANSSAKDPESSPEFSATDEAPPLDPSHTYMEDCIAIMKHAIEIAALRVAFPHARREKVVVELANIGMHFGLEGLDGVTWHGVTYNQWTLLRERIWEATTPFLTHPSNRSWTCLGCKEATRRDYR